MLMFKEAGHAKKYKTQSYKPIHATKSLIANSSVQRPKHIRRRTENGSCGISSILLEILFVTRPAILFQILKI